MLNHLGLEKHKHREGWLMFVFNRLVSESLDRCKLRLLAVDGADIEYVLDECGWPWPAGNFRCGIKNP
jgi:hypothetical protein